MYELLSLGPREIVRDTIDVHFNHFKSMVIFSSTAAAIYFIA